MLVTEIQETPQILYTTAIAFICLSDSQSKMLLLEISDPLGTDLEGSSLRMSSHGPQGAVPALRVPKSPVPAPIVPKGAVQALIVLKYSLIIYRDAVTATKGERQSILHFYSL